MNTLTAVGGILSGPFSDRATLYGMESLKWSLLASYYYVYQDCPNTLDIVEYFKKRKICTKALKKWTRLRKNYQQDVKFGLYVPLNVIKIHLSVLGKPK